MVKGRSVAPCRFDYDLCVKALNVTSKNIKTRFEVFVEDLLAETDLEGRIKLLFDDSLDVDEHNRELAFEFCTVLFEPRNDHVIRAFSKYGIMGFSASRNAFGDIWNMVAVQLTMIRGQDMFDEIAKKPQVNKRPTWLNIACIASTTAIRHCVFLDPEVMGANPRIVTDFLAKVGVSNVNAKSLAMLFLDGLQNSTVSKTSANSKEDEQQLKEALRDYFFKVDTLLDDILSVTATKRQYTPLADQLRLCNGLHGVFNDISRICQSSAVMKEVFMENLKLKAASGGAHAVNAVVSGFGAATAFNHANLFRRSAQEVMDHIPAESIPKQLGRILGFVTDATPLDRAKETSRILNLRADREMTAVFIALLYGLWQIILAFLSWFQAFRAKGKADVFKKIHKNTFNVGVIALQARTVLLLQATMNESVNLEGPPSNVWEAHLRARYGDQFGGEAIGPDVLQEDLKLNMRNLITLNEQLKIEAAEHLAM